MIRLGTRGSKLAMWQALHVQTQLADAGQESSIVEISTVGDRVQNVPLHAIGVTGIFTKALDDALEAKEIDIAVHSAKDLPSKLDDRFEVAAFLKREDPRDVLVAVRPEVHFENLTSSWVIGTSSVRRQALIKHYLPAIQLKDIRGNVDTRISKLESGEYDGIMLAFAGLKRLGLERYVKQKLNLATFTPAVGQGAIAVVARKGSPHIEQLRSILHHLPTGIAVEAERSFLHTLEGGCHTPAFAFANVVGDNVSMTSGMANKQGRIFRVEDQSSAPDAVKMGEKLARQVLDYVNP
ncbi:MAG: hydroxymethylbilane synthase [Bacteroidia bacterium]